MSLGGKGDGYSNCTSTIARPRRSKVSRSAAVRATSLSFNPSSGTVRAFSRRGGLLRPLLTSASRSGRLTAPQSGGDAAGRDADLLGKPSILPRTSAGCTVPALDGYDFATSCRSSGRCCLISGCCSSDRDFVPRFLQTVPRGSALALHSCFTSIRLHRALRPPGRWICPAHRTRSAAASDGLRPSLTVTARAGFAGAGRDERMVVVLVQQEDDTGTRSRVTWGFGLCRKPPKSTYRIEERGFGSACETPLPSPSAEPLRIAPGRPLNAAVSRARAHAPLPQTRRSSQPGSEMARRRFRATGASRQLSGLA